MPTKRIIFMGDQHGGHVVGLTPPRWQKASGALAEKTLLVRKETWKWYTRRMKALQPIWGVVVNGDCVDGRGERSGSTELLSTNRFDQCEIAIAGIAQTQAKVRMVTRGTAYHTGNAEDFEDIIADKLDAKIADHLWPEINGVVFDVKYHIGGTSVPYGRATAISKDQLWNKLWAAEGEQPLADVLIRSHVHWHEFSGDTTNLRMTLPSLQAAETKFGARRCSGTIDYGFVVFDINHKGEYSWHAEILKVQGTVAHTSKM